MRYKVRDKVVATLDKDGVWEVVKVDKVKQLYLLVYSKGEYISDKLEFNSDFFENSTRLLSPLEKAMK